MSSFFCIFAPRFESALFVHPNPLKRMKKFVFGLLFLVSCLVANAQGGGVPVDGIIAVIGKEIIMQSDLEKHYLDYASQFKTVEDPFETRCYILETLVFNKLMVIYKAPSVYSLIGFNGDSTTYLLPDYYEGSNYFGGSYSSSKQSVTFRISEYVQSIIMEKKENMGISMGINGASYGAQRLVINGPNAPVGEKIRLEVTYSIVNE